MATHAERARAAGFDIVVGTSGTILALGSLAHAAQAGSPPESLHHLTVSASALRELRKRLVASTFKERRRLPVMDERRADIIVAGAVVLDTILESLQAREIVLCEWALREGLLIDYLGAHPRSVARADAYPDVRRRSVVSLAEKCGYDEPHARQVARLALELFDGTHRLHGLGPRERSLLEFAALLHDVGRHISYPGRHKHTFYLIRNGDLRGFHPLDIEVLALVGRYHRQGTPRRKNLVFAALPRATAGPCASSPGSCAWPTRSTAATGRWPRRCRCARTVAGSACAARSTATPASSSGRRGGGWSCWPVPSSGRWGWSSSRARPAPKPPCVPGAPDRPDSCDNGRRRTLMVRTLVASLLLAALAVSPAAADKGGQGKGKSKGKDQDAVTVVETDKGGRVVVFADRDRDVVRTWRVETYGRSNCPPGLAKKNRLCMPPGQYKKRYVVGRPLPTSVAVQRLPPVLVTRLGPVPTGYEYVMVDGDILKLAVGTRLVADAIEAILD